MCHTFNDFDETVTCVRDMFHGRIIDDFSMTTIDSTTADNHESTLGTGTNDLEDDTSTIEVSCLNALLSNVKKTESLDLHLQRTT